MKFQNLLEPQMGLKRVRFMRRVDLEPGGVEARAFFILRGHLVAAEQQINMFRTKNLSPVRSISLKSYFFKH